MRLAIFLAALAGAIPGATIPSGTPIQIRLTTAVQTASAKADQPVEALIISPIVLNGSIAIAAGAKVSGHVQDVQPGNQTTKASVLLAFSQLTDGASTAAIQAKVTGVDNARETVDSDGRITGILASDTGVGRLDQGINKVSQKYGGLGDLLNTVKQTVLKDADTSIDYQAGVEMTITLTSDLAWTGVAKQPNVASIEPQQELDRLVNSQPYRTATEGQAKPSDVTNLMFVGSREQIQTAFQQAGWSLAEKLSSSSKLETFRALAEDRGYKEGPMSILMLDGAAPDMTFEKVNNTYAARHHLRIWHRPGSFHGQDVWVCASTHDTGIDFSEQNRTFIHKIDSNIDNERSKVVNDLLLTGLVHGLALVSRDIPTGLFNATGDKIETDGAMAVVQF